MSDQGKHYFPQMVAHWANLVSITFLVITGLYIHYPFTAGVMGPMRIVHFLAAFLFTANIVYRLYYAFFGRHKDYFEFKPELNKLLSVAKYYAFLGPEQHSEGKYNALQKLTYIIIPLLIIFQAVTGFAMAWPEGMLAGFVKVTGGLANLRAIHYLGTWVFISFTLIHAYMVFFEAPQQFWAMFFGKEIKKQKQEAIPRGAIYNAHAK